MDRASLTGQSMPDRSDEFARFIRDERETAERIVRESGLQPK